MSSSVPNIVGRDGSLLIDLIYSGDVAKFSTYLDSRLKDLGKICHFCTSEIRHKGTREIVIPVVCATKASNPGFLRYMLSRGLNPSYTFTVGRNGKSLLTSSLLIAAIESGNTETTDILLAANADVNFKDYNGETALHQTVRKLNAPQIRLVLSYGADPSHPDRFGNSALHSAVHSGHLQIVQLLLKCNVDIYQKGKWGILPLQIAAREGHAHIVELLCKGSSGTCNLNVCVPCSSDRRAKAPIHLAAGRGNYETLSVLLEDYNADPTIKDKDKNTALHFLVLFPYNARRMRPREDYVESARVLVSSGANVNAQNRYGDTALHLAVMNGYQMVVEILVESGADPNIENQHRLKPCDMVMEKDTVSRQILQNARKSFKGREEKLPAVPPAEDMFYYTPTAGGQQSNRLNRTMDIDDNFMVEKESTIGSEFLNDRSFSSPWSKSSNRRSHRSMGTRGEGKVRQRSKSVEHIRRQMSADATLEEQLQDSADEIYARTSDFAGLYQTTDGEYRAPELKHMQQKQVMVPRQIGSRDPSHVYAKVNVVRDKPTSLSQYGAASVPSERSLSSRRSRGRYLDSSLSQASTYYSPDAVHAGLYQDGWREQESVMSPVDVIVDYNNAYSELEEPSVEAVPSPRATPQNKPVREQSEYNETDDSIKVSTVRGKPRTIAVEYGGKTLEIAVGNDLNNKTSENSQMAPVIADSGQLVPDKKKSRRKKQKPLEYKGEKCMEYQRTKPVVQNAVEEESNRRVSSAKAVNARDPAVVLANILLESAQTQVQDASSLPVAREKNTGPKKPFQPATTSGHRQTMRSRSMENIAELSDSDTSESEESEPETVRLAPNHGIKQQNTGIKQTGPRIKIGFTNQDPFVKKSTFV